MGAAILYKLIGHPPDALWLRGITIPDNVHRLRLSMLSVDNAQSSRMSFMPGIIVQSGDRQYRGKPAGYDSQTGANVNLLCILDEPGKESRDQNFETRDSRLAVKKYLATAECQERAIAPTAARTITKPIRSRASDIPENSVVLSEAAR